jgi:hypothetical protein
LNATRPPDTKWIDPTVLHGGGNSGVCAVGFSFKEDVSLVSGPLTAILAVRHGDAE